MAQCNYCGEKIDSLAYECNSCGRNYCDNHRLPEKHDCVRLSKSTTLSPDFRGLEREESGDGGQSKADSERSEATADSESEPHIQGENRQGPEQDKSNSERPEATTDSESEPESRGQERKRRSRERGKPDNARSENRTDSEPDSRGQAGKRHRNWKPSSRSPDVVVDDSDTGGEPGRNSKLPLAFRLKRGYKRVRRTFWRRVPSVKQLIVLALMGVVTLLLISSIGGIGVGPIDDASDRTSEILDEPVATLNDTVQEGSIGESGTSSPTNEEFERAIHAEINDIREQNGLNRLEYSTGLAGVARDHSQDMEARDYFDHDSPEDWTPQDRVDASDDIQCRVGENIYTESGFSHLDAERVAERVVENWMNSPGHRDNILFEEWSVEGIGVHIDGQDLWATQKFC